MSKDPVKAQDVRALADEVKSRLPEAARSVAEETLAAVSDGLRGTRSGAEIIASDGGKVAVGAGIALLATGFIVGRVSTRGAAMTALAAAGGFAAGYLIGSQFGRRPDAAPAPRSDT